MTHQAAGRSDPRGGPIHEEQRARILHEIPRWYHPGLHIAVPAALGLGAMAAAIGSMKSVRAVELLTIPATLLLAFGVEWRAHKSVLHKRQPGLGVIYDRHELQHHVVFTYDDLSMRARRELWLILMPAYAVVLVFMMVAPIAGLVAWLTTTNAALLMVATSMVFFLSYEWMHMAYHLPPASFIGRNPLVARLREHHRRHHDPRLMRRWNFNVTVPVFDWIHRTIWSPLREQERSRGVRAGKSAGRETAPAARG